MSVTSAKSGATGISLALDNNYMEPIATTVVGSTAVNSITFNDIPQGYKHLQLRGIARGTSTNTYGKSLFNSDASSNYSYHALGGNGTSAYAGAIAPSSNAIIFDAVQTASNTFSALIIDILDYTNTNKYKTIRSLSGGDANGSGEIYLISSNWRSMDAIVSINLTLAAGNFAQYSRFSLYGVKG